MKKYERALYCENVRIGANATIYKNDGTKYTTSTVVGYNRSGNSLIVETMNTKYVVSGIDKPFNHITGCDVSSLSIGKRANIDVDGKMFLTSPVLDFVHTNDLVHIETKNSVYTTIAC